MHKWYKEQNHKENKKLLKSHTLEISDDGIAIMKKITGQLIKSEDIWEGGERRKEKGEIVENDIGQVILLYCVLCALANL